jgi:TolB-like protein/Flp pilus assembly protein TadD
MDLLSRIAGWLGENEATISAVAAILAIAAILFTGLRFLLRRSAETAPERASGGVEAPAEAGLSPADLDPLDVPGFEGRPAIAVLPFDNLSGDPDQEYFADGLAEDLITRLSAWREFPVIARNSSFTYKGKPVDVKQVSRGLGVRYIVEGSVRKAGERVRISAQLIDATTGGHVWAERYDREMQDIFAVQDEITQAIVASMYPELEQFELARVVRQEPENLDAWDSSQRGMWHLWRMTREENARARSLFEQAAELDPHHAFAFTGLAFTHYADVVFEWTDSPARSIAEADRAARTSIALDSRDPYGQMVLSRAHTLTGQMQKAIAASELAIQINPSMALAYFSLGLMLSSAGRPDDGIAEIEKGIRLSPRDPLMWLAFSYLAFAHFAAQRYEEAIDWAQRSLQQRSDFPLPYAYLAASHAHLGRAEEARAALEEVTRQRPDFSLTSLRASSSGWDPTLADRYFEGLRKAGMKE